MDGHGADNDDYSPERRLQIAALAGFQCFDALLNDHMYQANYRLPPDAHGNGPDGWFFGHESHDHITDILN